MFSDSANSLRAQTGGLTITLLFVGRPLEVMIVAERQLLVDMVAETCAFEHGGLNVILTCERDRKSVGFSKVMKVEAIVVVNWSEVRKV